MLKYMEYGTVLFWAGTGLLFLVLIMLLHALFRRLRCSCSCLGLLLDTDLISSRHVRLIVQYTVDGEVIVNKEKQIAFYRFISFIGAELHIRYNPNDPDDFYVVENRASRIPMIVMFVFGLFLIFLGYYISGPLSFRLPFGPDLNMLLWRFRHRW